MKPGWISAAILALSTETAWGTYSVLAVDTESGEMGGFAVSCIGSEFSLSEVITVRPDEGVVAAQGYFYRDGRDALLAELEGGESPGHALSFALSPEVDPPGASAGPQFRQYAVIDRSGLVAQHSGDELDEQFGHRSSRTGDIVFSVQGNVLSTSTTLDVLESGFESEGQGLPTKLLAALSAAASSGGGDARCAPRSGDSGYFAYSAPGRLPVSVERYSSESEVAQLLFEAVESELPEREETSTDPTTASTKGTSCAVCLRSRRFDPFAFAALMGLGILFLRRQRPRRKEDSLLPR